MDPSCRRHGADERHAQARRLSQRANRVVCNYAENIAPFAILVLVAYVRFRQAEPARLADIGLWAAVFFWARVVHALVYWLGLPYIRTIAFVVGVVATAAIFALVM